MEKQAVNEAHQVSAEGTAAALIRAGVEIFGKKGFDATSTREIAAAARTNVASIAYHFGGKEGLRLACARAFADHVAAFLAISPEHDPHSPAEAEALLLALLRDFARHLMTDHAMQPLVGFALREISDGGPGTEILFTALICPAHSHFCRLWSIATGEDAEANSTKLFIFSVIGQILYFRIAAPIIRLRLGWAEIGADETAQILATLDANFRTLIARTRRTTA